MLIYFIKFIHLLCTLGLLGIVGYCLVSRIKQSVFPRTLNKLMLLLAAGAAFTGTLLIYPKHFTIHTPWIKAAYVFVFAFVLGLVFLIKTQNHVKLARFHPIIYVALLVILVCITHDAVTKTTFL